MWSVPIVALAMSEHRLLDNRSLLHRVRVRTIRASASATAEGVISLFGKYSTFANGSRMPFMYGMWFSMMNFFILCQKL